MKFFARIILLFLWLFAVTAPSIITLCDVENPIVITNLNEEEQESGKKSMGEEKFVKENLLDFSIAAIFENSIISNFSMIGYMDLSLEVPSPPPDYIS
ncbi:hypothetical protein LCGC14_0069980 [marine sediment metagenome]|uniref:Uncharacterized protein n=1 Tax=marine sediment metagenome TaxID=412755 RepID=A0A0F9VLI9_9ZZZZ|nr:hypothetical protein [Maribacter sp.]HDZ05355.1 hypothetical protein [Maribacter sp.]HEA81409.1 hypothetical protein [Maribacter sp.]